MQIVLLVTLALRPTFPRQINKAARKVNLIKLFKLPFRFVWSDSFFAERSPRLTVTKLHVRGLLEGVFVLCSLHNNNTHMHATQNLIHEFQFGAVATIIIILLINGPARPVAN